MANAVVFVATVPYSQNDMMEQQKLQQAAGLQTTPPTSSPHSEPAPDPPSHSTTPALSSSQQVHLSS